MRFQILTAVAAAALLTTWGLSAARAEEVAKSKTPPVRVSRAEAKRMVRVMDDIYRSAVIATHRIYVREPGLPSAVAWGKQVIAQVNDHGWPQARIFDGSGRALNPENNPIDSFERTAVQRLTKGEKEVEIEEGGALRFATPIRAIDQSCISCHVRAKVGDLLGGVSYRAPLALESKNRQTTKRR